MTQTIVTDAVAVFCGSSLGKEKAFQNAAASIGAALAIAGRRLVFGGGRKGIMGVVSGAVLEAGGRVTGVIPHAMVVAGGEKEQTKGTSLSKAAAEALFDGQNRRNEETILVDSMHERKLEMARRSCAFVCLPGGYGTFEELLEVVTWSQLGIHNKPILVLNVRAYYEPLRQLFRNGVQDGYIHARNEHLVTFIDGPSDISQHDSYDWGSAAIEALDKWRAVDRECYYDWSRQRQATKDGLTPL